MLLALVAAAITSIHVAAGGFFVALALLHALFGRGTGRLPALLLTLGGAAGAALAWGLRGEMGPGTAPMSWPTTSKERTR